MYVFGTKYCVFGAVILTFFWSGMFVRLFVRFVFLVRVRVFAASVFSLSFLAHFVELKFGLLMYVLFSCGRLILVLGDAVEGQPPTSADGTPFVREGGMGSLSLMKLHHTLQSRFIWC